MKKVKKIFVILFTGITLTLLFAILGFGLDFHALNFIQPLIFAAATVVCIFYNSLRRNIIIISLFLLFLMIITYLINKLDLSNWIGSTGFGILAIVVFSYIPQLLKEGNVEKY